MKYLVILLMLLLMGCSSPAPAPEDHFYRLPAAIAEVDAEPMADVTLVEPLKVGGLIRERPIVYVDSRDSIEMERYHYHLWYESPGYMLQQHLAGYLRDAGIANSVTTSHSLPVDVVITGKLHEFMHIRETAGDQVVVRVELMIKHGDNTERHKQKMYTEYEPVKEQEMTAVVAAFGRALNRIYNNFLAYAQNRDS